MKSLSDKWWYEENEVVGKWIIEEDDLTLIANGKIFLEEKFCERIRIPVQENEEPVGFRFIYDFKVKKYYGLYDRTNCIKLFKEEDLKEHQMRTVEMLRQFSAVGLEYKNCEVIGICYGKTHFNQKSWSAVYDVSKTKAYRKYRLEKLFE